MAVRAVVEGNRDGSRSFGEKSIQQAARDHPSFRARRARQRERDLILPDGATHAGRTPAHWRRVALIVARMTGKRTGVDTATRMLE